MKKAFYSISTLFIATLLGISFYTMLFNLFVDNALLAMALISFIALIVVSLVNEPDFIQEIEE